MKKFILLLAVSAVLSAQYTLEDLATMGNGDYMDLMSMYGDHTNGNGMLMGGDLNGQMIFGAGREEDLGFGHWLKKKVFNKKNVNKAVDFGGKLAMKELNRRIQNGELSEEELMSIYGDHTNGRPGLLGAVHSEEDLGFGHFVRKHINKKHRDAAVHFGGHLVHKAIDKRLSGGKSSEEDMLVDLGEYPDYYDYDPILDDGIYGVGPEIIDGEQNLRFKNNFNHWSKPIHKVKKKFLHDAMFGGMHAYKGAKKTSEEDLIWADF